MNSHARLTPPAGAGTNSSQQRQPLRTTFATCHQSAPVAARRRVVRGIAPTALAALHLFSASLAAQPASAPTSGGIASTDVPAQPATTRSVVLRFPAQSHDPVTFKTPTVCGWPARSHICSATAQQQWRTLNDFDATSLQRSERWLGEDKLRHFFASWAAAAFGFGATRLAGIDTDTGLTLAIAGAAIAGLSKEWADARAGGFISLRDLAWDAAGITAAFLILRNTR